MVIALARTPALLLPPQLPQVEFCSWHRPLAKPINVSCHASDLFVELLVLLIIIDVLVSLSPFYTIIHLTVARYSPFDTCTTAVVHPGQHIGKAPLHTHVPAILCSLDCDTQVTTLDLGPHNLLPR